MSFLHNKLNHLRLTPKLIITYTLLFIVIFTITISAIYISMRDIIKHNIESELENSSMLINNMIESAIDVSIKTHLRTIAEVNKTAIEHHYNLYQNGDLTEEAAKESILNTIRCQTVGTTGYVYILNSSGIIVDHPFSELVDSDLSEYDFIQEQMVKREGYLEYDWQNPSDETERQKSLYMMYFEPWDWIISVSSYSEEFYELLSIKDFEEKVLSIKFGDTGYPAILDTVGNFLVHPILQGDNITTSDIAQSDIMTQILEMKNGIIEYKWQNPEDDSIKDKIMVFSELKAYNWFIISTAYKDEFYNPLNKLTNYTIVISLLSMIVIVAITMQVSRMIILPIKQLESTVLQGVNGDLSVRLEVVGHDEISDLRSHFNTFMDTLETQQSNLVNEISEKEKYSTSLQMLNDDLENIVEKRTNELEVAQRKATYAEKLKSINQFIIDLSHHINTPLGTSVTTLTYIGKIVDDLRENYWDNKLSKVELEEFFKAFNQSYDLVLTGLDRSTDLMDMFKLLSDNERYNQTSPMSVKKILRKITNAYSDSQHKIVIDCDDDLIINSHDNVLELIIHQLLKNSLLHAYAEDEVGLITINASVLNNYFLLDVTDNGKGIHAKDMPYVFEPFYKGYKDSERLGLGLSIVQNAVKYILDGNLEIESTSEETTFSVIVPLHGLN